MHHSPQTISLGGTWRFEIDPENKGMTSDWHQKTLSDSIQIPGTMDESQKGFTNSNRLQTMHLGSELVYEGAAWYQTDFELDPSEINSHRFVLNIERTRFTSVWLNGQFVGSQDSLGCAQKFILNPALFSSQNTVTVRVDNKDFRGMNLGHMVTYHTQVNWNGLLGEISLEKTDLVWIEDLAVYPDLPSSSARLKISLGNSLAESSRVEIRTKIFNPHDEVVSVHQEEYLLPCAALKELTLEHPISGPLWLWNEFTPHLYRMEVELISSDSRFKKSIRSIDFGMRSFTREGRHLLINNQRIFLRGKHDAMIWPLLGYPSMSVADWEKALRIAKSYGINHYRFHSCTPPRAAFIAADRVGIYLQPELYNFGTDISKDREAYAYTLAEGERILKEYASHPSFIFLSLGNEMMGGEIQRSEIIQRFKSLDNTRLYSQASNYDFNTLIFAEGDDYWTTVRTAPGESTAVRGSFSHADLPLGHIQIVAPSTLRTYDTAVLNCAAPVISHETGQFQVFPSFDEIEKYTGVQKPWNFEVFKQRLEEKGMISQWKDFVQSSGALTVICYREEIEACLRTQEMAGFRLLDIQDFPGQGTALVGILDSFMDSKNLITPQEWSEFCSPTVLLALFPKYTWESGEKISCEVKISHFGLDPLVNPSIRIDIFEGDNSLYSTSIEKTETLNSQGLFSFGFFEWTIPPLESPKKCFLKISLVDHPVQTHYPLWIYPPKLALENQNPPRVFRAMDAEFEKAVESGEDKLLLIPDLSKIKGGVEGFFASDFWCFPMFYDIASGKNLPTAPGTLGLLCDSKHPLFNEFPTENHSNWQWWRLMMNSRALILDSMSPDYKPLVQIIDNFDRNHKLGVVFEVKIKNTSLLICTMDLLNHSDFPECHQFYKSLLHYFESSAFQPQNEVTMNQLHEFFQRPPEIRTSQQPQVFNQFFNP